MGQGAHVAAGTGFQDTRTHSGAGRATWPGGGTDTGSEGSPGAGPALTESCIHAAALRLLGTDTLRAL